MAKGKLIFKHGVMEAGKSAELLMKAFLFREKGKQVLILKPSTDTRDLSGTLTSRVGLAEDCEMLAPNERINDAFFHRHWVDLRPDIILVDEAQFLSESQVEQLANLVDTYGILCIAYGLKCDFSGHLFEGSKRLIELADRIDEAPSMCKCGRKAIMHYRRVASKEQVLCGDTDVYESVCRPCFMKLTGNK